MYRRVFSFLFALLAWGAFGQERLNLALVSVDTLRADFLGCYGGEWAISPNIDALADKALVFENATCEMPLTGPSFAAMFTSRYPRMVGATRNGMRVVDNVKLVAEMLHEAGYYTFAVQSNWTLRGQLCGLNRGFESYDDSFPQRRWGIYKGERRAEEVAAAALAALEARPQDRPFFAWFHFTDPHAPYRYRSEYSPVSRGFRDMNRTERVRVRYASEVAYTDHYLGQVLAALPEGTAVVFVADHGESLYEHDYLGHGRYLYQNCMHVPLMIRAPGLLPGRTGKPVQTLDIGPTLLGLAGLKKAVGMLGLDVLRDSISPDRPRFMETYGGAVPSLPGAKQIMRDTSPARQAVLQSGWKYVSSGSRPDELYHIETDPDEQRNIAPRHPEKLDSLRQLLVLWNATHGHAAQQAAELSDEDMEALRSLGYMD